MERTVINAILTNMRIASSKKNSSQFLVFDVVFDDPSTAKDLKDGQRVVVSGILGTLKISEYKGRIQYSLFPW